MSWVTLINTPLIAGLTSPLKLPLGLLNAAQGHPMLVELKNGETLNGHLVNCDTWMNLSLKEVVQTSPEGDKFMRLPEVYVRGNNVLSSYSLCNPALMKPRSSTYVSRMRLSIWSRNSNRANNRVAEAEGVSSSVVIMAEEAIEAEELDEEGVVEDVVVVEHGSGDYCSIMLGVWNMAKCLRAAGWKILYSKYDLCA